LYSHLCGTTTDQLCCYERGRNWTQASLSAETIFSQRKLFSLFFSILLKPLVDGS
jgi:hypothetical protein